jgi:hypothetical protein
MRCPGVRISKCFRSLIRENTYNLDSENGWVGYGCVAVEVVTKRVGLKGHGGLSHVQALEAVEAGESDGLVEVDLGRLETLDMDEGFTIDGHAESLVDQVPGVVVSEGLLIHDMKFLADINSHDLVRCSLWHLEVCEYGMARLVFQI